MTSEVINKLFHSITTTDWFVGLAALLAVVMFVISLILSNDIKKRYAEWQVKPNVSFSRYMNQCLSVTYTLFTTTVSLFPLLGMLGTVLALLGLDLSVGDMESIKNNFFFALTSTAWGIIFSVIFKLLNAPVANYIEEQIENSRKMAQWEPALKDGK